MSADASQIYYYVLYSLQLYTGTVNYSVVCLFVLRLCVWGVQYWRGVLSVRVIEYTG